MLDARAGHSTEAMAATTSNTASQSCQCSTSPSHHAPVNTPKTGMNITLKLDAKGGKLRANPNHAAWANTNTPMAL